MIAAATKPANLARIGEAIRTLRQQRGLTLKDVASAAGLSVGFLSLVERGLASLSLLSVYAIADALSIPASYFLGGEDTNYKIFRASQHTTSAKAGDAGINRLSMEVPNQTINFTSLVLPAKYDSGTISHEGEKVIFVVSGHVEVQAGEESFKLGPTDAMHFRATLSHRLRNAGKTMAVILCGSSIHLAGPFS